MSRAKALPNNPDRKGLSKNSGNSVMTSNRSAGLAGIVIILEMEILEMEILEIAGDQMRLGEGFR